MNKLFVILLILGFVSCSSKDSVDFDKDSVFTPDFGAMFGVRTDWIPVSHNHNALVIEQWYAQGWVIVQTVNIFPQVDGKTPFYWMSGYSESTIQYAFPGSKSGYILTQGYGKLMYQGVEKGDKDAWNVMYREKDGEVYPCIRVTPIEHKN